MIAHVIYFVFKTSFVKLGAGDVWEVQSLIVEKNYKAAGSFACDIKDLAEPLVCSQGSSPLNVALRGHLFVAFVCMCESLRDNW